MSKPPLQIRIEYDSSKCIANQACIKQDPFSFKFDKTHNAAVLVGGTKQGHLHVIEKSGDPKALERTLAAAAACPVNAFRVVNTHTNEVLVGDAIESSHAQTIQAKYDDAKDFVLDPQGYFLIRVNHETKTLEAGFCNAKNTVVLTVSGKKPIDIYHTIALNTSLNLRKEHYAYLGRELEKAYHCLQMGLAYVQDDELHAMKARKK